MDKRIDINILDHFEGLEDPRIDRKKLYPLSEILLVVLCGSICSAKSWREFVIFGEEKIEYLRRFLAFENGIPSKNTIARVLSMIDPEKFKTCFINWVNSLQKTMEGTIAIDGKTLRKSFDRSKNQSPIHMLSAFSSESGLVIGQQKVESKSNEVKAIPVLLDLLDIEGSTVSIDAMGTQKVIAKKIRSRGADYVLALKGNQGLLHKEIKGLFDLDAGREKFKYITDKNEAYDKGHGRVERRTCYVSDKLDWLDKSVHKDWPDLKTVAMIESEVSSKGKTSIQRRYFISSLEAQAGKVAQCVRNHWDVENRLHWVLDVTLGEDSSRIRKDHAPENMAVVRHITLNMLQMAKKTFKDMSIRRLQKKAGWGDNTLDLILGQKF